MQLLRQLYMTMLWALRHQYLDNLLEMQALCTLLCSMHSSALVRLLKHGAYTAGSCLWYFCGPPLPRSRTAADCRGILCRRRLCT